MFNITKWTDYSYEELNLSVNVYKKWIVKRTTVLFVALYMIGYNYKSLLHTTDRE